MESYLTQKLHYNVKFTTSERLFGVFRGSKALNHITTLTRKHIHFSKLNEEKPNMKDLEKYINQTIQLEKYGAKISQTSGKFETKWENFI